MARLLSPPGTGLAANLGLVLHLSRSGVAALVGAGLVPMPFKLEMMEKTWLMAVSRVLGLGVREDMQACVQIRSLCPGTVGTLGRFGG